MADGYIVYQGDAKGSVEYFKKIDRPMPQFANPADFFMKILAIKYPKKKDDEENYSDEEIANDPDDDDEETSKLAKVVKK